MTSLGGTTLPSLPIEGGWSKDVLPGVSLQRRMADFSLRTTALAADKFRWPMNWKAITSAEEATCETCFAMSGTKAYVTPVGGTVTVQVDKSSWKMSPVYLAAGTYYNVSFAVLEQ